MGDEHGQGGVEFAEPLVLFLDENHCGNRRLIDALQERAIRCEKHLDHFEPGTEDLIWLPVVGGRRWGLLTTDARIRSNLLEKEAICENKVRMFYFSRNNLSGREMGVAIVRALPAMQRLWASQPAPFTASITKLGDVKLRDTFRRS